MSRFTVEFKFKDKTTIFYADTFEVAKAYVVQVFSSCTPLILAGTLSDFPTYEVNEVDEKGHKNSHYGYVSASLEKKK